MIQERDGAQIVGEDVRTGRVEISFKFLDYHGAKASPDGLLENLKSIVDHIERWDGLWTPMY